ncbi:YfhO family protein [Falsibacillus albus]|nr:YfhO family protein [Falsibacillus albus]
MKNKHVLLIFSSIILSILAHAFFLYQTANGSFMAGPHDGLSQMIPFRKMVYDQFSKGNFFYSFHYGLGGGTYQLAYYYANNIFYFFVFGFVFILDKLSIISTPDALFWANATIYISIIRLSLIFIITTYVFRYMKIRMPYAFVAAFLYGGSIMYFRHVTYWEFFSDAFLWLPLFVLGIEKVFREQKPTALITAVALSMFDNFYFAYIHFIFMGIYIVFRWLIPLDVHEKKQVKLLAGSILLGAGISSVSFIPAVYGFLHNFRPAFKDHIPIFDAGQNAFLGDKTIWLPVVFVLFLFIFSFYKNHTFKLFAWIGSLFILFHFSPIMASVFNGFSAPQFRFEYIINFCASGAIAAGLQERSKLSGASLKKAFIAAFIVYCTALIIHPTGLKVASLIGSLVLLAVYFFLFKKKKSIVLIMGILIVINLIVTNAFQYGLYKYGGVQSSTKAYMTSEHYNSDEQRKLIQRAMKQDNSDTTRMDWIIENRNNTPIVEDFNGISAYSSILNKNILFFYYKDLKIDMKRESVSRYNSLGDRANLYSLLRGKYIMYEKGKARNIPYGFKPYVKSRHYVIYRNENVLPFVRTTSTIYSSAKLKHDPVIDREHAMLKGVVLNVPGNQQTDKLGKSKDLMQQTKIQPVSGTYQHGQLHVDQKTGGLDMTVGKMPPGAKDLYLSFYLKNNSKTAPLFPLSINEFKTSRKSRSSIYRTTFDHITVRIQVNQTIKIRVPKGSYTLNDFHLYSEGYQTLKNQTEMKKQKANVDIEKNHINVNLQNNRGDSYMVLPIPYEKGWTAHVNGKKQNVQKANYAFIGIPIKPGQNHVELTYYPPYFELSLAISGLSLLLAVWWIRRKGKLH